MWPLVVQERVKGGAWGHNPFLGEEKTVHIMGFKQQEQPFEA